MPPSKDRQSNADRVVLLIDLDCFYAQCECIRLGYDSTTTALALLQWNSVLAVTYPARELYGIKRGDGWEEVRKKSNGKCLTVHVPILSHQPNATPNNNNDDNEQDESTNDDSPFSLDSIDEQYEKIFQANDADKENARKELGVRRFSQQGKACIERYRIASRRIFSTVLKYLETLNSSLDRKIVMERASIDELFLDVSGACFTDVIIKDTDDDFQQSLLDTKTVGGEKPPNTDDDENDLDGGDGGGTELSLQRGVVLARRIRQHIREKLGFTMTAGIGQNKTIAKLSASYGKPNGQAVTYSYAVNALLNETEIKSCRNFGGKLGKRVQALLPPNVPTTIGSIAKYLSLPDLEKGLGDASTARWAYQVARGVDTEAVVVREQALIKSITAFKSLPFNNDGHTVSDCEPWIRLLAQEVVKRVEQDAGRNKRYPRSLNIHYAQPGWGHHKTLSIRIDFPSERLSSEDKINMLASDVPRLILKKAGKDFKIHRIGLCAENFLVKEKNGLAIDSYFTAMANAKSNQSTESVRADVKARSSDGSLEEAANGADGSDSKSSNVARQGDRTTVKPDRDLELALKLQAEYDREQRMLETLERRDQVNAGNPRRHTKKRASGSQAPQSRKIDSFFQKR